MPLPSPFHSCTSKLCRSMLWKDWAGYYAVRSYFETPDPEYFALRHAAGLIDVTPLFKYEVRGPDAGRFLARVMVRNIAKLKVGRVTYVCWCDDDGKVVDDGTVTRIEKDRFRVTSAEPSLGWFERLRRGYDVTIEESTERIGALSLQGPNAREVLRQLTDADLEGLAFFAYTPCRLDGVEVELTRTGYTGDLGYEIWVARDNAESVYDRLLDAGRSHGLLPAGLDAMDATRIEAGFIMNGVDYFSAHHCLIEPRKSSPFELNLGWTVKLEREPFVGQAALERELAAGPSRRFVGLVADGGEIEERFDRYGLPPELPA
ncbi:MAG: aminomethyltransferase family protein, partial [Thermoanaerobaculia bacterium]|nr:aminomethyltransferase family protein [Thermoanaerobaculia bacterium]